MILENYRGLAVSWKHNYKPLYFYIQGDICEVRIRIRNSFASLHPPDLLHYSHHQLFVTERQKCTANSKEKAIVVEKYLWISENTHI